ncbi:hypothetical protein HPP92_004959 [Vanilla planifolia]|uniref:Aminotransferase class V domain-containing protein n=1 Tax=Vanilla planifolia TaxID=51239 RepID=A0A835VCR7_VANPL|nr:hypothetical protein HPP92_004959 [Vanilla planifolia]
MVYPCGRATASCLCCLSHPEPIDSTKHGIVTTIRSSRSNFVVSTISSLFPNSHFTNPEALPSLHDALSFFSSAFPHFNETQAQTDHIRRTEYPHLFEHVCLDYSGVGLFSHFQMHPHCSSLSPSPFFIISYRSASLKSEVQCGEQETVFESSIRKQVTSFLKISEEDYGMLCVSNRTAAFRLLAETFPFQSKKCLLTVYDYESEAITAMAEIAQKRGAVVSSARFSWPSLSIHSAELKKLLRRGKKRTRGLFVFPLMSRVTGKRYPYLWMKMAQEKGWHVALDACTLGPKDMDTMGMTLIQPDFVVCSFYKVFGENPSGFAGLFIKKSSRQLLESSLLARGIGVVSILPTRSTLSASEDDEMEITRSFSGPLGLARLFENEYDEGETSEKREPSGEIIEEEIKGKRADTEQLEKEETEIEFRGLYHADLLGLPVIQSRLRCLINWLVIALTKLRHPLPSNNGDSLVRIYGPKVKFDRGSAIAFNVFDWKGEKVEPFLVQKLAGRSNISLNCGFLHNIFFCDHKHEANKQAILEKRPQGSRDSGYREKEKSDVGIAVVSASLGFLVNFEDAYKLWAFVAKFLDADFVEKERQIRR